MAELVMGNVDPLRERIEDLEREVGLLRGEVELLSRANERLLDERGRHLNTILFQELEIKRWEKRRLWPAVNSVEDE